jgi:hypothetical protein
MDIAAVRRALTPALADVLFAALVVWLLLYTAGGDVAGLLSDAGAGVHIRTGEAILQQRAVPRADWFSFTKPAGEWFAWEWLADVVMALAFRAGGLGGVSVFFAALWALNLLLLTRLALDRGGNAMVVLALTPVAVGAASVHFLARPHAFTITFLLLALGWMPHARRVWLLAPLTALWANIHGGFVALFAILMIEAAGAWLEKDNAHARRTAEVLAACACASLLNPYGWRLHAHLAGYLRSGWLRELVEEFKAPLPDSPSWPYFVILLWAGVLLAGRLASRRRFRDAMLVALWAYAAMTSIRHLAVYAFVLIPILSGELSRWSGLPKVIAELGRDHLAGFRRHSVWPAAILAGLFAWAASSPARFVFPPSKYPVALIERHAALLDGARVWSSDAWSDYLIWRFAGRTKVALDGRSDFYGEALCREYANAINGRPGWRAAIERRQPSYVLAPAGSPLNAHLSRDAAWAPIEEAGSAGLYRRR